MCSQMSRGPVINDLLKLLHRCKDAVRAVAPKGVVEIRTDDAREEQRAKERTEARRVRILAMSYCSNYLQLASGYGSPIG